MIFVLLFRCKYKKRKRNTLLFSSFFVIIVHLFLDISPCLLCRHSLFDKLFSTKTGHVSLFIQRTQKVRCKYTKNQKKVRFSRSRPSINVYCLNRDFCYLSYNDLREEILCITSMLSIQRLGAFPSFHPHE